MSKLNKIYLVTEGEYSDYHIIGAFSTKEKAQSFIKLFGDRYGMYLEDYEIDKYEKQIADGLKYYIVHMKFNGDVEYISVESNLESSDKIWSDNIQVCVWAKDEKHAIKIANERRIKLKLEGKIK